MVAKEYMRPTNDHADDDDDDDDAVDGATAGFTHRECAAFQLYVRRPPMEMSRSDLDYKWA